MKRWLAVREWRIRRWLGLTLVLATLAISPVRAVAISQGYQSSESLPVGSLVGLDPNSADSVRASNTDRVGELYGVVVDEPSSLIAVSATNTKVQVVTTGTTPALVSNVNGDIKKGDAITASPISGVGMKATASGRIIGMAQADFSAKTAGVVTQSVGSGSSQRSVAIGAIPVAVAVSFFTAQHASGSVVPQAVQNLASFVAGKPVSTVRILTAAALLILGLILVVIILNSAVRSSMESIGRNPLARSAVSSGLLKVLILNFAILLVTFGSVYFVVKG